MFLKFGGWNFLFVILQEYDVSRFLELQQKSKAPELLVVWFIIFHLALLFQQLFPSSAINLAQYERVHIFVKITN